VSTALRATVLACAVALPGCGPTSVGPRSSQVACQRAARALMRLGVTAHGAASSDGAFRVQVAAEDAARAEAVLTSLGLPEPPSEAPRWLRGPGELAASRALGRAVEAAQALEERGDVLTARIVASPSGATVHVVTPPRSKAGTVLPAEVAHWLAPSLGLPQDAVRVEVVEFAEAQPSVVREDRTGLVTALAVLVLGLSVALLAAQRKLASGGMK